MAILGLFLFIFYLFKQKYKFTTTKYGAGIQINDVLNISLLP